MNTALRQLIDTMRSDPQAAMDIAANVASLEPGELTAILGRANEAYAAEVREQS